MIRRRSSRLAGGTVENACSQLRCFTFSDDGRLLIGWEIVRLCHMHVEKVLYHQIFRTMKGSGNRGIYGSVTCILSGLWARALTARGYKIRDA